MPDEELIRHSREQDRAAFAELWHRHAKAALFAARQFTTASEPEDLVAEAYTRIWQQLSVGRGPNGAFRPYLYATIRNLASRWATMRREIAVDDLADYEDPASLRDGSIDALDRSMTAQAFLALPERWQSVLWYTVVEGMQPREVAPLLGMTTNGTAALSHRAREGLRVAWLQAHVAQAITASSDCAWAVSRIGDRVRQGLSKRNDERMTAHLVECEDCNRIANEVHDVGSLLALSIVPLILGSVAGASWLTGVSSSVAVATAMAGALPGSLGASHIAAGSGTTAVALGGASVATATGTTALLTAAALTLALSGSGVHVTDHHAVERAPAAAPEPSAAPHHGLNGDRSVSSEDSPATADSSIFSQSTDAPSVTETPAPLIDVRGLVDGTGLGIGVDVGSAIGADAHISVGETIDVGAQLTAPLGIAATARVTLSGTGTPGATVTVRAAGIVYGSVTIGADGRWTVTVDGLSSTAVRTLQVSQTLPILGGLLGKVLGVVPLVVTTITPEAHPTS